MKFKNLTKEDLWKLRKQIVLNSLFIADYENDFEFNSFDISHFMGGYYDYLQELMEEDNCTDLSKYDNEDNLFAWFNCYDDLDWIRCRKLTYKTHKRENGEIYTITAIDDCGSNEGGLFCEIYDVNDNDIDDFTIPNDFYGDVDDYVKNYMTENFK